MKSTIQGRDGAAEFLYVVVDKKLTTRLKNISIRMNLEIPQNLYSYLYMAMVPALYYLLKFLIF